MRHRGLYFVNVHEDIRGQYRRLPLTQLLSVIRRECACVRPDALWGCGDDSGSSSRSTAPPPTAGEQRLWLAHTPGLSSQLETERRIHTHPALFSNTLTPPSSNTGGRWQHLTVADAALCVTGDSAQRGPIRQRGRNRRCCCFRALPCTTRSSTGERLQNQTENDKRHFWRYFYS